MRIDVLTGRLPAAGPPRFFFDLAAAASLTFVAALVTSYGWRVFYRSWESGSRANTPLETPLWIPQSIWLAGWAWLTFDGGYREHLCGCADADAAFRYCANAWRYRAPNWRMRDDLFPSAVRFLGLLALSLPVGVVLFLLGFWGGLLLLAVFR